MLERLYLSYKRFVPQLQNNCCRFSLARPAKKALQIFPFTLSAVREKAC
jgi:hypothetical protein